MKRDPGLQPERTHLSWRRTGWSMLAPGLLCFRGWSHTGNLLYGVAGMLLMAGSFAIFCGALTCRHVVISFNVMIAGVLLLLSQL
ncbi:DUF202 domain-containing protein [Citrobacter sp. RHBSTW-00678]|uniref:DUF202 domain-containing protein n=2 Tax=Citrobacter braakii TaxID=57706 RepID=A0A5A9DME4_CITBR|nr:DUF202 domain-containing protein [Citrobacter braakii]AUV26041.1 DUF202 domain-containing protein [Citrobacter freundii complex sp. CFNIH3]MBA7758899.1 DUF202 domain-containing protein [Citrobacter sp. RHBSTW-00325]MBU5639292.1 DUF202 domain-containing protein [Citrobacter sp. S46_ASV_140]MBU5683762.1 DUF202 domain-containing protein [Citrobacter sp. S44_ASV_140]PLC62936.1 hypothetical protein B9P82_14500 [Citrobacter sp. L55]POV62650.1 DUF202 domain-containing protein [Citrobacter freundi